MFQNLKNYLQCFFFFFEKQNEGDPSKSTCGESASIRNTLERKCQSKQGLMRDKKSTYLREKRGFTL